MARYPVVAVLGRAYQSKGDELRLREGGDETAPTVPFQGVASRTIALRIVNSLRATAMIATFLGLPLL